MTILAFVFVLGVLIFVHELGHYLFAKRYGMQVNAFAIFANQGRALTPTLIDYIQDRNGRVIWRADTR